MRWSRDGRGEYGPNGDQSRTVRKINNSTLSRQTSRLLLRAGQLNKRREQFWRGKVLFVGCAIEFTSVNRFAGCVQIRKSVQPQVHVAFVIESVFAPTGLGRVHVVLVFVPV